ncbi:hypothetical protein [Oscillatoria acuminata]|nr:hypothetical protein [Oscillatoria acuminata]
MIIIYIVKGYKIHLFLIKEEDSFTITENVREDRSLNDRSLD